ncbi:MAG: phosphatidate cytidylyltransferase [Bacteroides sp.]|nr:phosphatidate cytidylyltransferase [Bacteroides sp.]
MIATYYILIIIFFLIGALGIYMANRKRNKENKKQNWVKYGVYFIITHVLFLTVIFLPKLFPYVCVLISIGGAFEIIRLQLSNTPLKPTYFALLIGIYIILSLLFILFGMLEDRTILFSLFMVLIFDAFCQISGQISGKTKIVPKISPNKTVEGLIGGTVISILASCFLGSIMNIPLISSIILGIGICFFAFAGDLFASWIKRLYNVKDFGNSLPGHGGFLDRFDSLIPAASFVYAFFCFIKL